MLVNEIADPLAPHRAVTADACLYRSRTRSSVRFSAVSRLMSQGLLFGLPQCAPGGCADGAVAQPIEEETFKQLDIRAVHSCPSYGRCPIPLAPS